MLPTVCWFISSDSWHTGMFSILFKSILRFETISTRTKGFPGLRAKHMPCRSSAGHLFSHCCSLGKKTHKSLQTGPQNVPLPPAGTCGILPTESQEHEVTSSFAGCVAFAALIYQVWGNLTLEPTIVTEAL